MSCETRACRRWGHLIAVSARTDPIEASTDIGINSVDAQNYGGTGMDPNLIYGGTGVYSLQPQWSRQLSCEALVLKHRRHGNEVS